MNCIWNHLGWFTTSFYTFLLCQHGRIPQGRGQKAAAHRKSRLRRWAAAVHRPLRAYRRHRWGAKKDDLLHQENMVKKP